MRLSLPTLDQPGKQTSKAEPLYTSMLNSISGQRSESMFVFVHTLTLTIPKKDPLRCISDGDMTSPKRFLFTQSKQRPRSYRVINDLFCFESGRTDCGIESFPLEPSFWELGVVAYEHWFQKKKKKKKRRKKERIVWPGNTAYIQTEGKQDYVTTGRSG